MPEVPTARQAWAALFRHFSTVSWLDWNAVRAAWAQVRIPAELGCDEALLVLGLARVDRDTGEWVYRSRDGEAWLPPAGAKPESVGALQAIERRHT